MSGSAILNQQQHSGLQQLTLLGSVACSSLGPNKTFKFIQDEASGESSLVSSCHRLLENLEPGCAVGQLVSETVQAHHKVYRSGSGCLLFVAGAWGRAALECLRRGLSVSHVVSGMSEGMAICLDVCVKNSTSLEDLGTAAPQNRAAAVPGLQLSPPKTGVIAGASPLSSHLRGAARAVHKARDDCGRGQIKVTHSRHFHEVKSDNVSVTRSPRAPDSKNVDISSVAEAVSHGCFDSMNLIVEAGRIQSKIGTQDGSGATFDISKLVTCVLPGLPEDSACVLPGCVVLLSTKQTAIARRLTGQRLRVALVNGDLCARYRHLGFNRPAAVGRVTDNLDSLGVGEEEEWTENVLRTLSDLDVSLVLVNGVAGEKLLQRCFGRHLLVVDKVKPSVLKAFARATGAVAVTYATQLNGRCVGTGARVTLWRDLSGGEGRSSAAVNITADDDDTGLVTAVLTGSVRGKLQASEDRFWSCASRLHHALEDGALLPGAGRIEMLCVRRLRSRAEESARSVQQTSGVGNPYRGVVLPLMADGLMDYIATVMVNSRGCSKIEAWTAVSQQLKDLNAGLCIGATFLNSPSGDEMEECMNSLDVMCSKAPSKKVCDNLSVKLEAWRRALDVVLLVLQTDAEIITGIDQKAIGAKAHVALL